MKQYISNILDKINNPAPKSDLFPYEYYDAEEMLFINCGASIGFLLQASPIVGSNDNLLKQLSLLFDEFLPEGGYLQFLMMGSSNIEAITDPWLKSFSESLDMLKVLSEARVAHLKKLTEEGDSAYRVKNYQLYIAYTHPSKVKDLRNIKAATQEVIDFRHSLETRLSSVNVGYSRVDVDGLLELVTEIVAPGSKAFKYNPYEPLSNQIAIGSPLFAHPTCIKHGGTGSVITRSAEAPRAEAPRAVAPRAMAPRVYVSKCYGFEQTPLQFSISLMGNLLGDASRDNLQIPGRVILSYTICNNISSKKQMIFKDKGEGLIKQLDSFLVKFDTRLKKEGAEWLEVEKLLSSGKKLLTTAFTVMLTAPEAQFAKSEQYLRAVYIINGFRLKNLDYFMLPSFLSALPFSAASGIFELLKNYNIAKTSVSTEPLSLLPIHGEWKGNSTEGLLLTGRRGQVFTWSPYFGESNYNLCVVGQSGSGKSVLLQDLVTNLIATGTKVFVLDIGRSYDKLCRLLQGDFIEFSSTCDICLNPFSNAVPANAREEDDFLSLLQPIIAKMAAPKRGTTDIEDSIIASCLQEVWRKSGTEGNITHIIEALKEVKSKTSDKLAQMLFQYSGDGNFGRFFEGQANVDFKNKLTVIEFDDLRERKDLMAVIMQMLSVQIMTQIFKGDRQQRFAIIFDEAWFCLEHFPSLLANLARTVRKYNGSLILGTQSVNDFFTCDTAKSILENAGWLLMLKQKKESVALLLESKKLSLDKTQVSLIESLNVVPGKYSEVLISSSSGYVVGRLMLEPFSKILYSTSPKEFHAVENLLKSGVGVTEAITLIAEKIYGKS